jgi:hypothetical protein
MLDWTIFRIRGDRGPPTLDVAQFLACISAARDTLEGTRWHLRWSSSPDRARVDGLRVALPFDSLALRRVGEALESRIPPPDGLVAEPLRRDVDLDPVQSDEEMEACLELLWRWSELLCDLRTRNPGALPRQLLGITPGAFLTFVTGDRRHFERAVDAQGFGSVPAVPFSRVAALLGRMPLSYRVPPRDREEAVAAARIHHLAGCTAAAEFYPYAKSA